MSPHNNRKSAVSHFRSGLIAGLALLVLGASPAVRAQSDESDEARLLRGGGGDPVAGKEKSFLCQGCHGADGISFEPIIPKLAGQYGKYVAKQIRDYQSGIRSHQIMNAMAGAVDDADLADIGAYFASQRKMRNGTGAVSKLGEQVFLNSDLPRSRHACVGCHGPNGKGSGPKAAMYPVIGGQHRAYILKQLYDFRAGYRVNSPNSIMNIVTRKMTDEEIEAVADYVSAQ